MRITGAGDPTAPLEGHAARQAAAAQALYRRAAGYSSYGNQIGLATGLVDEIYHPGYVAKRLEIGAVVAAAPEANVVRARPEPGDVVILLGGRTGRDGIGGATAPARPTTAAASPSAARRCRRATPPWSASSSAFSGTAASRA